MQNTKKEMVTAGTYETVLKNAGAIYCDKPIVLAFLDENKVPHLSLGEFSLNDLTFIKHLIDKHIDETINKSINLA